MVTLKDSDLKKIRADVELLHHVNQTRPTRQAFVLGNHCKALLDEVESLREVTRDADAYVIHPAWETKTPVELLEALRFQGAMTSSCLRLQDKLIIEESKMRKVVEAAKLCSLHRGIDGGTLYNCQEVLTSALDALEGGEDDE